MTRGNAAITKVHFKGNTDDFIVFVESAADVEKWRNDSSIPLAQVVNSFKIMLTHKHGAQGTMDGASNAALDNEFGTHDEDEVIKQILTKGSIQSGEDSARGGDRNISQGGTVGHGTGNRN